MNFTQLMRSLMTRVNNCVCVFNCFPFHTAHSPSPLRVSPASLLSLVFFQIASRALAVESRMWSLKDLRRGALRGRASARASGSPISAKEFSAALVPRPFLSPAAESCAGCGLGLCQAARLRARRARGRAARSAAPSAARHCGSPCGRECADCRRPPGPRPSPSSRHIWKGLQMSQRHTCAALEQPSLLSRCF